MEAAANVYECKSATHGYIYFACRAHGRAEDLTDKECSYMSCSQCSAEKREYARAWWASVTIPDQTPRWVLDGDCCALAERQHCVCIRSTTCPAHGIRCRGSHE